MKLLFEIERNVYIPHGTLLYLGEKAREFAATGTSKAIVLISRDGVNLWGEVLAFDTGVESATIFPRFAGTFDDESGKLLTTTVNRGAVVPCVENDPED